MTPDIENIRSRAQDALDELFTKHLIPFPMFAIKVDRIGNEEYIVRFYDSRLHSLDISWAMGQNFREIFRASILDRFKRLNGPLHQFSPRFAE
jgi:hypothetical protein